MVTIISKDKNNLRIISALPINNLTLIQENSVIALYSPETPSTRVMGSLVETHFENDVVLSELAERIIWCESKGNPTAKNPSSTAYGLCQFLDGTWEYVQEKWGIKLDRDNPDDQLYACVRLLEEEGLEKHWKAIMPCLK